MSVIANGRNTPLNVRTGSVPDVGGAMRDWFQPMVFTVVAKSTVAFQAVERAIPIRFQGVIQPLSGRRLMLKPEGQRAWTWLWLHADPALTLEVDQVVMYLGKQTRVMNQKDYTLYGYVEYELVQDWTGSGPEQCDAACVADGGQATTIDFCFHVDGGATGTTSFSDIDDGGIAQSDICQVPEESLDGDIEDCCAEITDGGSADTDEFEDEANGGDTL